MSLHLIMISLEFFWNVYLTLSELNDPLIIGEDVNLALVSWIGQILNEETCHFMCNLSNKEKLCWIERETLSTFGRPLKLKVDISLTFPA